MAKTRESSAAFAVDWDAVRADDALPRLFGEFSRASQDRLTGASRWDPMLTPMSEIRHRRRRPLAAVASLAVAASLLAACGGGSDDASDASPSSSDSSGHQPASPVAEGARHVEVGATSFEFAAAEIRATAGEDLAIVLTAEDGAEHDFTVDELDTHVAADPGETAIGGLRADEPGRYAFYCSVPGHREAGMEGVLVVEA